MRNTRLLLDKINKDILDIINKDLFLKATQFSDTLLSNIFRSVFRIHKSFEFDVPEIYQLGDDPENILWSRLTSYHALNFGVSLASEQIFIKRYQQLSEYEFVILADVSRSMMVKWWYIYGSPKVKSKEYSIDDLYKSKLFLLKYILASFLSAAKANGFISRVILFGGGKTPVSFNSRIEPELEKSILFYIDDHFADLAKTNRPEPKEPLLPRILKEQLEDTRRRIILCISDFMDGVKHLDENKPRLRLKDISRYLAEMAYKYRLLVIKINDERELVSEGYRRIGQAADTVYYEQETNPKIKGPTSGEKINEFIKENRFWHRSLRERFKHIGAIFVELRTHRHRGKMLRDIEQKLLQISAIQGRI